MQLETEENALNKVEQEIGTEAFMSQQNYHQRTR